jgi:hypothetical protein
MHELHNAGMQTTKIADAECYANPHAIYEISNVCKIVGHVFFEETNSNH